MFIRYVTYLLPFLLLAGCYPLGMTEKEWTQLTPQQQHEARMKEAELQQARIIQSRQLNTPPRPPKAVTIVPSVKGDAPLFCMLKGSNMNPVSFSIRPGEQKFVSVTSKLNMNMPISVTYAPDSTNLTFCPNVNPRCSQVSFLPSDLKKKFQTNVNLGHLLKRADVVCEPSYQKTRYHHFPR